MSDGRKAKISVVIGLKTLRSIDERVRDRRLQELKGDGRIRTSRSSLVQELLLAGLGRRPGKKRSNY